MTREAEWDEEEREKFAGLALFESDVHVEGCGFHDSLARNPSNLFETVIEDCPLCAAVARRRRQFEAQDKRAIEAAKDDDSPLALPSDGRRVYTRRLSQGEAERRRFANPKEALRRARATVRR